MKRSAERPFSKSAAVALATCSYLLWLAAPADAQQQQQTRHAAPHKTALSVAAPGQIVVHTGREIIYTPNPSYNQDPWQAFLAGPHYYADTALSTPGETYSFGQTTVLPSRFDPPGQVEPLFRF
jgi:hypothetical protein